MLNESGLNINPIISNVGMPANYISTNVGAIGYLKVSPNGKKLALANEDANQVRLELFDFDNSTGIISNPLIIDSSGWGFYGIEFSPDNSKLYATTPDNNRLYQYDISSSNIANIIASQTMLAYFPFPENSFEAAQLGPDGKIYLSATGRIGVINYPNNSGASCGFQDTLFYYPNLITPISGLPNFIDGGLNKDKATNDSSICINAFPVILNADSGGSNFMWSNGISTQSTSVNTFGSYWVSFINIKGCNEVDTFNIELASIPVINVLHDTSQCSNSIMPITENATFSNVVSYLWNDGYTNPIHTITYPSKYIVTYTLSNFCISKDSFNYIINTVPEINIGSDTTFCLGNLSLNAYYPNSSYQWSTGQTTSGITITLVGNYWVKVTNQYGCENYDSLMVSAETRLLNFDMPNIVTPNNDGINDFIDFSLYQFSSLQLAIYNRWGLNIYESNNPLCIWKPTEDDGTYFFTINYQINCGIETQNKILKGFITISR